MGHNPIKRTLPFIAVCEGFGDVCFIAELLEHRNVQLCNVGCPTQRHFGDGRDAIPAYLKAISTDQKGLKGILVIVDSDDEPEKRFKSMAEGLSEAPVIGPF
jgi:hypothetical protein